MKNVKQSGCDCSTEIKVKSSAKELETTCFYLI